MRNLIHPVIKMQKRKKNKNITNNQQPVTEQIHSHQISFGSFLFSRLVQCGAVRLHSFGWINSGFSKTLKAKPVYNVYERVYGCTGGDQYLDNRSIVFHLNQIQISFNKPVNQ